MEDNQTHNSHPRSFVRFTIVAIILIGSLIAGLYFGKQIMMSVQQAQKTPTSSETASKKSETIKNDKEVADKNNLNKNEPKKTNEAKKTETSAQPAASNPKPEAPTTSAPSPSPNPAPPTGPNTSSTAVLPSTGPVEIITVLLGLAALSYGTFSFLRSKHELGRIPE